MIHFLKGFRVCAAVLLVVVAFLNLGRFNQNISYLPLRAEDPVVIWEDRLRGVRDALMKAHYMQGDVGYIRASTLSGRDIGPEDDKNWGEARYGMIPWNLLRHTLAAPYVIADFSGAEGPFELPDSFKTLYESGDGLVVLKREP